MSKYLPPKRLGTAWLVACIAVVAVGVRVWNLGALSITHPEAYTPGIPYPAAVTQPMERNSVETIVRSSFLTDNHPPGYYLLVLPWSRWAAADIGALRLPSALFGALTVPLLFLAARRVERTAVAILAAAWLALHGTHVLWSRSARMWALCTLAGVVSTWALTHLARPSGRRHAWEILYVASLAIGLWSDYTFWPLLATQIVCVLAMSTHMQTMPRLLGLQAIAVILGTPVLMFLMSRLGSSAYLEAPVGGQLTFFLGFDAWFDADSPQALGSVGRGGLLALAVTGAMLTGVGAWRGPVRRLEVTESRGYPLPGLVWLSVLWPVAAVWSWRNQPFDRAFPVRSVTLAAPLIVAAAYAFATTAWPLVRRSSRAALDRWSMLERVLTDIFLAQALLPFGMLLAASVAMPAVAPRSVLDLAPYMLVLASRGVVTFAPRRPALVAAGLLVTVVGGVSSWQVLTAPPVRDYKGLAARLESVRQRDDVVVIENEWYAAPLHYYLPPSRVPTLTPQELTARGASQRLDRFWVVTIAGTGKAPAHIVAGLREFQPMQSIDDRDGQVTLFVRRQ